ncbi:transmembrane protein, putative, partial [Bodo saltans]
FDGRFFKSKGALFRICLFLFFLYNTRKFLYFIGNMVGILSKKRKFVRDGVFYAELSEFLKRELAED